MPLGVTWDFFDAWSSVVEQAPQCTHTSGGGCGCLVGRILQDLSLGLDFRGKVFLTWSSFMSCFLPFLSFRSVLCLYLYIHTHG